jgi:hypothetical protein
MKQQGFNDPAFSFLKTHMHKKNRKNRKYIFVVGGVMSGVGKGISASSIGKILQCAGYTVSAVKIDPYVNVDAGTMNPIEHGETFVLSDGYETDQDMGNYERFLDTTLDSRFIHDNRFYLPTCYTKRAFIGIPWKNSICGSSCTPSSH